MTEVNLRYTVMTYGEETYMIPNSLIFSNPIRIKKPEGGEGGE